MKLGESHSVQITLKFYKIDTEGKPQPDHEKNVIMVCAEDASPLGFIYPKSGNMVGDLEIILQDYVQYKAEDVCNELCEVFFNEYDKSRQINKDDPVDLSDEND